MLTGKSSDLVHDCDYVLYTRTIGECFCVLVKNYDVDPSDSWDSYEDDGAYSYTLYASITVENKTFSYYCADRHTKQCKYGMCGNSECESCIKTRRNRDYAWVIEYYIFGERPKLEKALSLLGIKCAIGREVGEVVSINPWDVKQLKTSWGPINYLACVLIALEYRIRHPYGYGCELFREMRHSVNLLDEVLRDIELYDPVLDVLGPYERLMEAVKIDRNCVEMIDEV